MPERKVMTRLQTLRLLDKLVDDGKSTTMCFRQGGDPSRLEKVVRVTLGLEAPPDGLMDAVLSSKTGGILYWGELGRYLVVPPFPMLDDFVTPGYDTSPLRALLQSKFTIGVVLLRLGSYAIGVFRGDTLMSSKIGTGLVHSRHKKGGSSAHRFERHREKQMEYFFTRVCAHVREQLEPVVRDLDYVIYGGERYSLLEFRKQCQFLKRLDDRTLDTLANVRRPCQATLKAAIHLVWSSLVIKWQ